MPKTAVLAPRIPDQNAVSNVWPGEEGLPDTVSAWAERYFATAVTTGERSRKEQGRDFRLFLAFLRNEIGSEERLRWTPRVSREFVDYLRSQVHEDGQRRFADRTINRVLAHLKTFAKWIHSRRPFPDKEHPLAKLKALAEEGKLDLERALTSDESRRLLDAADHLPVLGGRSRDRRRCKDVEFADERPRRKGYRPWRNRAIIYTLLETGMRRAEVTSIDLRGVDFEERELLITEKGGRQRKCLISKQGLKAIRDYLREERGGDAELFPNSPALFLPADTIVNSKGRLSPSLINRLWNEVARDARVQGRTPHSARHAMGVHFVEKTHNPRAAQQQLGHKNPSTTLQYMQFSKTKMRATLDERK
jgi:site-specific recombinase XerD